jgi:hypothetical protein
VQIWRILLLTLVARAGCSRQNSDPPSKAPNGEEQQVGGKTIRVIVHRNPFKFDGVDRISILGSALNEVNTPIPFAEDDVDEEQVP